MPKYFPFIFSVFFIFSCSSEPEVPDYVLPQDKMIKVMRDLHLAEAYTNANYSYSDSSRYIFRKLEDSIFKAHETDQVKFDSSLVWYETNIKTLDKIYAAVVDSLSLMEGIKK